MPQIDYTLSIITTQAAKRTVCTKLTIARAMVTPKNESGSYDFETCLGDKCGHWVTTGKKLGYCGLKNLPKQ